MRNALDSKPHPDPMNGIEEQVDLLITICSMFEIKVDMLQYLLSPPL